jgi:hypothetical protein
MDMKKKGFENWKNEYIECFTSCLSLYSNESREYQKLKYMIEELKSL